MAKRSSKRSSRTKKLKIGAALVGSVAAAGAALGLHKLLKRRRSRTALNIKITSVRKKPKRKRSRKSTRRKKKR